MRILILGEGVTDLGLVQDDMTLELEGVLPILVRKLLLEKHPHISIEMRACPFKNALRTFSKRSMGPSTHGYAAKMKGLLALSFGREADAIVAVVDRDGDKNKQRIEELNSGRDELLAHNKPCAVGLAIETIEAWLLADDNALRQALGNNKVERQPDPEKLDARDNNSDRHPKGRLRVVLELSLNLALERREYPEIYARIADEIDLTELVKRCPKGFGPFAEQVGDLTKA